MCGIAGWLDWDRDLQQEKKIVQRMGNSLTHRGPDEGAEWYSRHAAFSHRRLIVVDPSGGSQPMVRNHCNRKFIIVYNGELYNTEDLRKQLKALGHSFQSYSDTEVLLNAYMAWGPDCLAKLNGIFAFAIWNGQDQSLFMARDRLGVKPLFFWEEGTGFLFGSEIKAILTNPLVKREMRAEGLAELLMVGPARTPGITPFHGIRDLKPGHYLVRDRRGTRIERYWQLTSIPHDDDRDTTLARVRELFTDAVTRQLISDVPVCTFLSGGLDSSGISSIVARIIDEPLHTYSVDYKDNDRNFSASHFQPDDDAPWAKRMSKELNTLHHRVVLDTPELVDSLVDSMKANDYPGMTDVDSSLLLFCRKIKENHTVALSGEAADEIFGGYPWFLHQQTMTADTFPWAQKNDERMRILSPDVIRAIQPDPYVHRRYWEALQEVPELPGENPTERRTREIFYLNITRFMATLLDRKDRMSMSTGLEVRVPFTDHRLVEYAWNVPSSLKFAGGREKGLLRKALKDILPTEVRKRRKSPYPKTHNPAYLKATRNWLLDVLDDPNSPLLPLIDVPTVRNIALNDGANFGPTWFGQLMGGAQLFAYLALIDRWLRNYAISIRP